MVIPSDLVPYELFFKLTSYNDEVIKKPTRYYETEQELYENTDDEVLEIKENIPLEVIFDSLNSSAKFYMDGLDSLPEHYVELEKDGGEAYLSPSLSSVILYRNNDEFYPYIPGLYRIKIVVSDRSFFSWLKILPKEINERQWEDMKNDVEEELKGLAQDLVRNSFGFSNKLNSNLSPTLFRQFMVIENRFPAIMAAISDLYYKINFRIKKEYMFVPQEKSSIIDEISIRHRVMHPETNNVIKTPIKKTDYDLPENRLSKSIIESLIGKLTNFIDSVELYIFEIENGIKELTNSFYEKKHLINRKKLIVEQLNVYLEKAKKMRGLLNWTKTAPWFQEISDSKDVLVPHVMTSDVRYRTLYNVQRELNNESIEIKFDKLFSYQWRRTDKLYEIWGFLQFIKILQHDEVGFKPTSGWIYNANFNVDHIIIPTIPKGTAITFEKENLIVKLVYEGKIPPGSGETNLESQPLYTTGTNNWPDGRMDIYLDNTFIGSLLFDLKYRPKSSIWTPVRILNNAHSSTMRQLVSYAFNCRSKYLFGKGLNQYLLDTFRPVPEVWALYPNSRGTQKVKYYNDHNVRLIELSPSNDNEHLISEINTLINNVVERSKQFVY